MNVLLPVRMGLDGISTDWIGLVQSLYYVGLLLGAVYSKNLIMRAGHIRMFAGCVSLGGVSMLICSLFADAAVWGGMRFVLGFCNACAFTAMESWLSDASTKDTRGKVLAVYNAVVLAGLFIGQFFMNIASPEATTLFVFAGVLLSLSVIPVVMSRHKGPVVEDASSMSLRALFKISPLGVVSCLISGLIYSAAFNLLPVFAKEYEIVDFQLSLYMGAAILGAFLLQFPVGYLSDRFDRRTVLLCLLALSAASCIAVNVLAFMGMTWAVFVATAITCGIIACTYPISISEAFDKLRQNEMVAAMGSMILAFSIGGVLGPYTASLAMQSFGNNALFYFLAVIQALLAMFVLYRMQVREALPVEDQENFVMQGAGMSAAVDLDPRTKYIESETPLSAEAETVISVALHNPAAAVKMAQAITLSDPSKGVELAGVVAEVEGVDVFDLFEVMKQVIPSQILNVTNAIVTTRPELATELVAKLAEWYPDQVVSIAQEIGRTFPERRMEMARAAAEAAPETAIEVAEYYAQVFADEREALRPADRADDTSEEDAVNVVSELWDVAPDQALDMAATMVDAVPETAVSVAEEYMASDLIEAALEVSQSVDASSDSSLEQLENAYQQQVDLVSRLAEVAPEQAVDVAVAVVEAEPESASEVAAELAGSISASEEDVTAEEAEQTTDEPEYEEMVELASRLAGAAPEQAVDVAVAVVEAEPESAAAVAAEIASGFGDSEYESENTDVADNASDVATSETDDSDVASYESSVELVSRLVEVAPDQAMDVAVAVVEADPDSAADVAAEMAGNIAESEYDTAEETDTSAETDQEVASDTLDGTSEHEAAVELVQRLSEAAPDNAMDVAVAVVESIPEAASDVVDAISAGDEAKDEEWMNSVDNKPES